MIWASVMAAAVAPGASLLAYFYLKDRYETEPIGMVARLFLFGALLVFPTIVLQRAFVLGFGDNPLLFAFGLSSGIEEFVKWFVLYFVIYKHVVFDEPYDGIVYAVAVSLGYATVENIMYAFLSLSTFSDLMLRAILPVSGHALFGVVMGYHLGRAKFAGFRTKRYLAFSLALPVLYHGLFDYILLVRKPYWGWLMLALMAFLWARSLWKVNHANSRSPLRVLHREDEVKI